MSSKNSFISLAQNIETLSQNSLKVSLALSDVVSSKNDTVEVIQKDSNGNEIKVSMPSIGSIQTEIAILKQDIKTLSNLDSRGAIIQPSKNVYSKIITSNINVEPNLIPELSTITQFITTNNRFIDSLLNPLLKVSIDLTGKIEDKIKKILSRRYIINFENDQFGNYTTNGLNAISNFNSTFKNRTNISVDELEKWIVSTIGVDKDIRGNQIVFDEEEFMLEYNKIRYEGFFTILSTTSDSVNKKMYFGIDTLDYYEIATKQKKQLQVGDELIINTNYATTRYSIIEINTQSSDIKIRLELVEGFEPIPVGVVSGMKIYSPIIKNKAVDITIGFNEYNVVFLKAIDTDNHIVGRNFSYGVSFFTNDLTLNSSKNNENNTSMVDFYVKTVQDFGNLLSDFVDRYIPRDKAVKPNAPILLDTNFRVVQSNTFLTNGSNVKSQQEKNQQINTIRSRMDETSKSIQSKYQVLYGKSFKSQKDKDDVLNQIKKLNDSYQSDSVLIKSTTNDLLASLQNNTVVDAEYEVQGFWEMVAPAISPFTRPQEAIAFYVEYKKANIDGKESQNETFKVVNSDNSETNAVFSPWKPLWSPLRRRIFNIDTQSYIWEVQNLSSIDVPNINSLALKISPNEQISIRVKTVSEVGYPDSIIESDWSNTLTVNFPQSLLAPKNPQELFQKNADLEDLRSRIESSYDAKGLSQHLSDGLTFENKYFSHIADNIGSYDSNGKIISLSEKLTQLANKPSTEPIKKLSLSNKWVDYGNNYANASYYLDNGRVYLSGLIKIDLGNGVFDIQERFPEVDIITLSKPKNTQYSIIGTIPLGYRPVNGIVRLATSTDSGNGFSKNATIEISTDGTITVVYGNSGWISLDNLSFRI